MVSKANNHATDWGTEGLTATLGWLAVAGVTTGGAGPGLDAARAPAYRDTGRAAWRWWIPHRPFRPWRWRDRR